MVKLTGCFENTLLFKGSVSLLPSKIRDESGKAIDIVLINAHGQLEFGQMRDANQPIDLETTALIYANPQQ